MRKGVPRFHDDTDGLSELAQLANSLLNRDYDTAVTFRTWSTIYTIAVDGVEAISEASVTGLTVKVIVSGEGSWTVSAKGKTQPMVFKIADRGVLACDGGVDGIWHVLFANDRAVQQADELDIH